MKNIKGIVFFDVDGTLIDCKNRICDPTEKTKEGIKKLQEAGYLTVLATGRPKSFITKGIIDLGLDGYITSNGTYIELNNEVILNDEVKSDKLKEILNICQKSEIGFLLEGQSKSYIGDFKKPYAKKLISSFSLPIENITDQWNEDNISVSKMVVVDNKQDNFKEFFQKFDGEFVFMQHPGQNSYDMYRKNYTKAYGIEYLINKLGFDKKKTYAFGDGENDIEMFQTVKYGIAMGDSHERLLPHAYKNTENVHNDGIYKALIALKLIK